jgi:hypothetical protein
MGGALAFLLEYGVDPVEAVKMLQKCRQGKDIPEGTKDWITIFRTTGGASFKEQVCNIYSNLGKPGRISNMYNTNPGWKETAEE